MDRHEFCFRTDSYECANRGKRNVKASQRRSPENLAPENLAPENLARENPGREILECVRALGSFLNMLATSHQV
jgi:hypothetical protein